MTQFAKIFIPDAYLGSDYASDLVINGKMQTVQGNWIKIKGCKEYVKKVYQNYLIF